MSSRAKSSDLAPLFAALADRTRLRLLNLIAGREVCVCYLVEILRQSQPKISRHLAYLRKAGVVAARREGKWMHYRIGRPSNAPRMRRPLRSWMLCSSHSSWIAKCSPTLPASAGPAASLTDSSRFRELPCRFALRPLWLELPSPQLSFRAFGAKTLETVALIDARLLIGR